MVPIDAAIGRSPARPPPTVASPVAPVHLRYRPDIDGLRALAVLSVVGFHAFSWWVPGGFVGVDVFFVISGYLITTIIVGDLDRGTFRFSTFYARRIRRILPALIVVMTTVWAIGWLRLFPDEYRQLGKHLAAGSAFVSNLVLRMDSSYFDNAAETKPLLHLWSLAIEEQFYVLWPLVLVVTRRWTGRAGTGPTAAIAVASFAYGLAMLGPEPEQAFYSPLARAWEPMIGGLLAQALHAHPRWFERHRELRAVAGGALLVVAFATFQPGASFPGWRALLPTVGTALVLSAGGAALLNRRVLAQPLAVWVGRISYPFYLWHWPLLSFVFIAEGSRANSGLRVGAVALAFGLAWATARFVERPIRASRDDVRLPLALLGASIVVAVAGWLTFVADGFPARRGSAGAFVASFDNTTPEMRYSTRHGLFAAFREECNFYDMGRWRSGRSTNVPRDAIDASCTTPPTGTTRSVFLWGDSHAEHLNAGLRAALPADVALLQVASSSCAADLVAQDAAGNDANDSYCARSNRYAFDRIRALKPEVVVIAQRSGHALPRLRRIAVALKQMGVGQVVVIGPIPQWNPDLNKVVAARHWNPMPDRLADSLDPDIVTLERRLSTGLKPDEPFVFIDLFAGLCDPRGCRVAVDAGRPDDLITFDYGHLTPKGTAFVGRTLIAPTVLALLDRARNAASGARGSS